MTTQPKLGEPCTPGEVGVSDDDEVLVCRGGKWVRPGDVQPGGRGVAPARRQLEEAIEKDRRRRRRRNASRGGDPSGVDDTTQVESTTQPAPDDPDQAR